MKRERSSEKVDRSIHVGKSTILCPPVFDLIMVIKHFSILVFNINAWLGRSRHINLLYQLVNSVSVYCEGEVLVKISTVDT